MFSLSGKVALVTGAGSGIGAAIAEIFGTAGATVIVADVNEIGGRRTVATIEAARGDAEFALLDVASESACLELADQVHSARGPLDVLVNNAGIGHVGTLLTTSGADFDRVWSVNVRGMFNVTRAFLPAMVERGRGSVINLASSAGI